MSQFRKVKTAVHTQMRMMMQHRLFRVAMNKDESWDTYLGSFKEEDNPIFRERTEHDCQCCKQFIRAGGDMVAIINNQLVSIWDVEVGEPYQVVVDALAKLVKSKPVVNAFLHREHDLGTDHNQQMTDDGATLTWQHFHFKLPATLVNRDPGTLLSGIRSSKEVFKRGLEEISVEALNTVLELIEQKSLYRGEEHQSVVETLLEALLEYNKLEQGCQDNYCWAKSVKYPHITKIRNSAIGTILVDISEGLELDQAVRKFEAMVAPANYKRPTALITQGMVKKAQQKVVDLGIEDALPRRYAITTDLTINNVLWADRTAKKTMGVFEELAGSLPDNVGSYSNVDEVDVSTFIEDILPKADSIELMLENRHTDNLMSLIAPVNADAKPIFKWDNNFSWAYHGEVTDSIKARVKKAGGRVDGVLRCSLSWGNDDDLDIWVKEPNGNKIGYPIKGVVQPSSGMLDVDMNADTTKLSRCAVENITWSDKAKMKEGIYELWVNQYQLRERIDVGFEVEVEYAGEIRRFVYGKLIKDKDNVPVAKFKFTREGGIEFLESLPSTQASREEWGITTQKFHKVAMVMNSPNHWDGNTAGNKHWFFILEGCKNDKAARGFFNEFLRNDLTEHRKVFEVLGSKMKTEKSDNQLSGLGFSSTQRNSVLCKVTGSFTRTIKLTF